MAKHSPRRCIWRFLNLLVVSHCLAIPISVNAQALPKAKTLTIEDGLGFREVTSVVQDHQGLMWIGTRQGLNRYDGYRFTRFGNDHRADQYFTGDDIMIDGIHDVNDSTLWVVADKRLYAINRKNFRYEDISASAGIRGDVLQLKTKKDGSAWLVWEDKDLQYLCRSTLNARFEEVARQVRGRREFTDIAIDDSGNVWWSTVTGGLRQFSPHGEVLHASMPDSFLWYGTMMYFSLLHADSHNRLFIFPKSRYEIWLYHPHEKRIEVIAKDLSSATYCSVEDKLGNMWFATKSQLLRWNPDQTWTDFTDVLKNALQFTSIQALYEDETHLLWVATDNGLIAFPNQRQLFETRFSIPRAVWGNAMRGIFEDQHGRIYAYCETGTIGLHSTDLKTSNTAYNFISDRHNPGLTLFEEARHFIADPNENAVWALNDQLIKVDLDRMQPVELIPFADVATKYSPNAFIRLQNGAFLLGSTMQGLTIFDPITRTRKKLLQDTHPRYQTINTVFFLENNDGSIWVATTSDGVYCIDASGEIRDHLNTQTTPAISNDHVLVLHSETDRILWIGTFGGGLNRLDRSAKEVEVFTQEQGLANDNVTGILSDASGNIWASTYNGLSCYRTQEGIFQNFYEEDGLTNNEFNYASFFKDSQGRLWFGGMNGVNYFDPARILEQPPNPSLIFTGYMKYHRLRDTLESYILGESKIDPLEISPYDSYFQCSWTLPNYFKPDKNTYYVWMEGLEEDWNYIGNQPVIRYHKLPAGHYTLHIKGADSKGNWSASELSVPVHVRPFFYQTWWFIVGCILLVAGFVYALVRYRLERLMEMERMRTRIAGDLHDEVGSMLSGIAMQAEILEMHASTPDPSKLRRLSEISRLALSKMRDVVWSIDSRRDKVKNLLDRMRENAEEMLTPKEITFVFELGALPLEKKLPVDTRQHLFLFFKEAITNISRHSDATEVTIRFGQFSEHFELSVHDNGTSHQTAAHSSGFGLQNMEIRAKKLGAIYDLNRDGGFKVSLKMQSL